jgi:hypothetical protein
MTFQKTTVTIAIIIFIITISIIAIMLNNMKNNAIYPPEIGDCPDYWVKQSNGECYNQIQGLGNCNGPINFNNEPYIGTNGNKKKCEWAKGCNLVWDGITNTGLC